MAKTNYVKAEDLSDNDKNNSPEIISLATDKAVYKPNDTLELTVVVKSQKGTLFLDLLDKEKVIKSYPAQYHESSTPNGQAYQRPILTTRIKLPEENNKQYLLKVSHFIEGVGTKRDYIAVNVTSDPDSFTIMGFLSGYSSTNTPSQNEKILNNLTRLHINTLQYYDYMEDHGTPVRLNEHKNLAETKWKDLFNRENDSAVIKDFIQKAKSKNMLNMAYHLINGKSYALKSKGFKEDISYTSDGFTENMMLREKDGSIAINKIDSTDNRYEIALADYTNKDYQELLKQKLGDVLEVFEFDGFHIDTLGEFHDKQKADGTLFTSEEQKKGFKTFLDNLKYKFWDKRLGFNAVASFGQDEVTPSAVSYLYSELWPWKTPTYNDVFQEIKKQIEVSEGKKSIIIPAYMNKQTNWKDNKYFNDASVIMMNLVTMCAGATRLEMGEHMLSQEYFPNNDAIMSDTLNDYLIKQYDFMVAYHSLLKGDNFQWNSPRLTNFTQGNAWIESHPFVTNQIDTHKISLIEKRNTSTLSLNLINTLQLNGDDWRDDGKQYKELSNWKDSNKFKGDDWLNGGKNRKFAEPLKNIQVYLSDNLQLTENVVWYATVEKPLPQFIELDSDRGFLIPELDKHMTIWVNIKS